MSRVRLGSLLIGVALALCASGGARAQGGYAPDLMLAWASDVDAFQRGPMDIGEPQLGPATHGLPEYATGAATGQTADVYSLGDGGWITLFFATGIGDGPGDDFAVYENGFYSVEGLFAEFAFVEVSSNGVDFARFDALSFRVDPVAGFEPVDPNDYENFGGDQPLDSGTGFDLAELVGHPLVTAELLDLSDVAYVRLIDVIGNGTTFDADAQQVWDPYPTPFAEGGFDAEAVGVLHLAPEPGAGALLGAGAGCLALLARWRTRAAETAANLRARA
jgi:hypothetical protein